MEWDDLKNFLAVARSGSLSEAAVVLKTSPATVGRRISALENRLNLILFDRRPTGYTLTRDGQAILPKAEEAETSVLAVERTAVVARDLRASGNVRVATTDDIGTLVIGPRLSDLCSSFPKIEVEIVASQELANLTRRQADIALRPVRPTKGSLIARRVGWWECSLYASRTHAQAHKLERNPIDWSSVSFITWTREGANLRGGPWLTENAPGAHIALRASTRRIHYAACKSGVGVAILPCVAAEEDPELVRLLPPEKVVSVPMWLIVHRELARARRIRAVMEFLSDAASNICRRVVTDRQASWRLSGPDRNDQSV